MTKELVKTNINIPSTNVQFEQFEIQQQALVLPKILLMQPLSDLVVNEKAKYGDFVNSLTDEVVGNIDKGIEVMPLSMSNYHIVSEAVISQNGKKDFKFVAIEPIFTLSDSKKKWSDYEGTREIKRETVYEFLVLAPAIFSLPFKICFKGKSKKAGEALYTVAFVMANACKQMPFQKMFLIAGIKDGNDKGKYAVLNSRVLRNSTQEEVEQASMWYQTLKTANIAAEQEYEPQATMNF